MIERKNFPLELKAVEKTGEFSGYLSVFGNMDFGRDIVVKGAFAESLKTWKAAGKLPPILWQHNHERPIGPFTKMVEDDHGLAVEGRLLIDEVQQAKEAHALMKNGVISGMSIGFETIGEEWDKDNRVRKLTKVNLWEGSIVTFPMNPEAQIEAVKSLLCSGELPNLQTFERFLREAGFSKSQAVAIANRGLSHLLRSESESVGENEVANTLFAQLKNAQKELLK